MSWTVVAHLAALIEDAGLWLVVLGLPAVGALMYLDRRRDRR